MIGTTVSHYRIIGRSPPEADQPSAEIHRFIEPSNQFPPEADGPSAQTNQPSNESTSFIHLSASDHRWFARRTMYQTYRKESTSWQRNH